MQISLCKKASEGGLGEGKGMDIYTLSHLPVITSREISKSFILKRLLITIFLKFYRVSGVAEARDKLGSPPHCSEAKPSAPCPHGIWQSLAGAVTYREAELVAGPAQDTPPRALQCTDFHCHLAVLKHQCTSDK